MTERDVRNLFRPKVKELPKHIDGRCDLRHFHRKLAQNAGKPARIGMCGAYLVDNKGIIWKRFGPKSGAKIYTVSYTFFKYNEKIP